MNDTRRPQPQSGVQLQEFDGELVLYDLARARVIYLSDTAALIWRLCDGRRTLGELIGLLRDAYPLHAGEIAADVQTAFQQLNEHEVLDWR